MNKLFRTLALTGAALASATVTSVFLASLAVDPLAKWVYAILAVLVEGLKVWAWSKVALGRWLFFALAFPATLLTLAGAVGFSTSVVDQQQRVVHATMDARTSESRTRELRLSQVESLQQSLNAMDSGYVTAKLKLSKQLETILKEVDETSASVPEEHVDPLGSVGHRFGVDGTLILELFLGLIALIVEAAIIALSFESVSPEPERVRTLTNREVLAFLDQHTLPGGRVRSRRELKKQNVPERLAKAMLDAARQRGLVRSNGRGSAIFRT